MRISVIVLIASLAGCGTTYNLADISEDDQTVARSVMSEEQSGSASVRRERVRFGSVVGRVEPAAEAFCRENVQTDLSCDIEIRVIDDPNEPPNAFQYYVDGEPKVAFTRSMIQDARNEDEIAFVLGHEMGHHMAGHLRKQQQQKAAGMIIAGMITGMASASNPHATQAQIQRDTQTGMIAGASIGDAAFSQTYELEADMIGTHIAEMAGYDAERGARIFARRKSAENKDGSLSFWGTHPPSEKRIALVRATVRQIEAGEGLTEVERNPAR